MRRSRRPAVTSGRALLRGRKRYREPPSRLPPIHRPCRRGRPKPGFVVVGVVGTPVSATDLVVDLYGGRGVAWAGPSRLAWRGCTAAGPRPAAGYPSGVTPKFDGLRAGANPDLDGPHSRAHPELDGLPASAHPDLDGLRAGGP